jgi:predicted CXXCH cytochrome family protein
MRSLLVMVAILMWVPFAGAQLTKDDCLGCHSDPDLVMEKAGKELSVHVDADRFGSSVHADFECTDCHGSIEDYPHEQVDAVDCSMCHDVDASGGVHGREVHGRRLAGCTDCHTTHEIRHVAKPGALKCEKCHGRVVAAQKASLHGQAAAKGDELAPTCAFCHGSHEMLSHRNPRAKTNVMNIPLLCGSCHKQGTAVSLYRDIPQEDILEHYVDSIHGVGLYQKGLTVTAVCTSCHTSHFILPHTDPRSSIAQKNIATTCQQCHGRIEDVHRKVIDGKLWEEQPHMIPACVDCHEPHEARRVFYDTGMANRDCLRCHGREDLTMQRDGRTVSLFVDVDEYASSSHHSTGCAQCHSQVSPGHERPCDTITTKPDCSVCHAEQVNDYNASIHGKLAAEGDEDAPGCLDCHSNHATRSKRLPTSPTFARNVPTLCARCHRAGEKAAVRIADHQQPEDVIDIVGTYADSIHGKGLTESGLVVTATCVNCHSSHRELPPDDPESTVNSANLAKTCGTCHHGVEEVFETSIHYTGEARDGMPLPSCNDCHSSHAINRTDLAGFRTRMMNQCGQCHKAEAETFFDTFHGKVALLGTEGAAKCSDCHGQHNILPTTDPASTLSRDNVVETCGQCHGGSHRQFAGYLTHATHHDPDKYPWLYWSYRFMVTLLVGTLSFFVLHTGLWLVRLWRTKEHWGGHRESAGKSDVFYQRFSVIQRVQHLVMLLSFFTLAITGMGLKFSYMGWAQLLAKMLGGGAAMGLLHRVAGVALIIIFGLHVYYVVKRKKEENWTWKDVLAGPNTLMFTLRDIKEFFQSFKWFLGLGERPAYGRYTYWEKFDYFAVFWGVMVIGSTGLVLWFPELFTRIVPGWTINVATIVHSDEALLAVAFIFTIHFFNTHFRPDKFPMDPVIFTGRVPLDEFKYDKPDEYKVMVESGALEEKLVGPANPKWERAFKVFGFAALAVGLTLIVLILVAMVFAYR